MYDVEHTVKASNAMDNPDGSKYGDHKLSCIEWQAVIKESAYILHAPHAAVMLLQATHHATICLDLPVIGRLLHRLNVDTAVKWEGQIVPIQSEVVKHARKNLYNAVKKRFMNDLMLCKQLEDFTVATVLDPRYKSFNFRNSTAWDRGKMTSARAHSWARSAWEQDWKPKASENSMVQVEVPKPKKKAGVVTLLDFMGDSDDESDPDPFHSLMAALNTK
ncbi:hypothetical protein CYMTET_48342 [Cymbomonas tetramitiformis]|uniref:Uncharacterized protein n=1 Tax=Cymbomonas tetramitiformis TaxID=36881 RepID=A0AAE0BU62_9CHLO|nr:hypothetical protein CYMTET_48342 [Cymbomonas tetramitiformis]